MFEAPLIPNREEFSNWVHDALNRLYDSPYLQSHPLATLLAEEEGDATLHPTQNVRRTLLEAIRLMRPGPGVPAQSPDWRAYRILELRYIEGLSPKEVMNQLSLGKSQYYRDQARVLETLSDVLWARWQQTREEMGAAPDEGNTTREQLIHSETERLRAQATWEIVDLEKLLDGLSTAVNPLAKAKNASVHFKPVHHLKILQTDRVMLRQALLCAITYALDISLGGRVEVSDFAEKSATGIQVIVEKTNPDAPATSTQPRKGLGLDVCRQLMAAMGGTFQLEVEAGKRWQARLAWPTPVPRILLAVDDNEGLIDLFRRYLVDHNWQVVGANTGAEARQVLAEIRPAVIALDVMIPGEDGWELLMSLKTDHDTRDIPVIICSVLNEPQLALELGAAAYLQKPVTQQALLRALLPWSLSPASLAPAR